MDGNEGADGELVWAISEEKPEGELRRISRRELERGSGFTWMQNEDGSFSGMVAVMRASPEHVRRLMSRRPRKALVLWVVGLSALLASFFIADFQSPPLWVVVLIGLSYTALCVLVALLFPRHLRNWWVLLTKTSLIYNHGSHQTLIDYGPDNPLEVREKRSERKWLIRSANGIRNAGLTLPSEPFPELILFLRKSADALGVADKLDINDVP